MAYINKDDKIKYNRDYNENNYDRINVTVKKGRRELIKLAASKTGESVNGFIVRLIDAELGRMESEDSIGADCGISAPLADSDIV